MCLEYNFVIRKKFTSFCNKDFEEKSAAQNFASAFNALGLCYKNGCGVAHNPYKALEFYEKAAALGHENAIITAAELKKYLK